MTAITPRLFLMQPTVVFAARVNQVDAAEYPVEFIAYDTVTTGDYTDLKDGMTLLLGSSAGADDYGRQRVRGPGDVATPISIFIGLSSQGTHDGELTLVDNAYITVLDERRLFAKMPTIDSAGETFKDANIEVSDNTTMPPPVANCGGDFAATIDPDTEVITVTLDGTSSFAVDNGATIADYLWDIADGTLALGSNLTDANPTVTFPAGYRYPSLTVTDSNSKTHTATCLVYARDPDADTSFEEFAIQSHRITANGQQITVKALADMPQVTYPDGCPALIWEREPSGPTDRDHMLISGWLDSDSSSMVAGKYGLFVDTTLTILDVGSRLDTLPGFSQSITNDDLRDTDVLPDITWNYMSAPSADKYIHYLLYWHSTALEVADFAWSGTGNLYAITSKSSDGESLWAQVVKVAQSMCPGYLLTCDRRGQLAVLPVPLLQEIADRTSTVQAAITEDDWGDIRFAYKRAPTTHWLRASGQVIETLPGLNDDGSIHLSMVYSIAPGSVPGQGLGETDNNEQLVDSQNALNLATGQRYARMNAPYGPLSVKLVQDDQSGATVPWREIEPAWLEWVTLTVSQSTAARRGLTFTAVRALPTEMNIVYNQDKRGLTRTITLTLEIETSGQPGNTVTPATVPAVGDQPEVVPPAIPPPDAGIITGQELVAGIGQFDLYRTSDFQTASGSGGPTWETVSLVVGDDIISWVVDPFSPGYIDGSGAINGFAATVNNVYRISDLFGTVIVNSIVDFEHTALWRTVQASFGTYFVTGSNPWLVCVSYYGSLSGHTGTWATYSEDGGTTWAAEVQVSAFYNSGGDSNPIGLYCSPKTPGLAYTVAHTETADPAATSGYVSHDWGATWTVMASDDPSAPLPYWGILHDGVCTVYATPHIGMSTTATAISVGGSSADDDEGTYYLLIAPPTNAVRVKVTGTWTEVRTSSSGNNFGVAYTGTVTNGNGSNATATTDTLLKTTGGALDGTPLSQDFTLEYTRNSGQTDWELSRDDMLLSAPTVFTGYCYIALHAEARAALSRTAVETLSITASIVEIELEDSTIYVPTSSVIQPVHGQGGEIHLPWPSNADESVFYYGSLDRSGSPVIGLQRVEAGTITDISQGDYGINSGHFAIRTHDSDRSFALLAGESGAGNSGVWVSSDNGDTWTEIVTPSAVTHYQAAFGGDDEQIIYIWGPAEYMGYSTDMGSTIDDRSGNLGALSATKIIGIAGGPTP